MISREERAAVVDLGAKTNRALVSLTPKTQKTEGCVFPTRFIETAYNNAAATTTLDDVSFHTLRHTFASWAVMRGGSLKEPQEQDSPVLSPPNLQRKVQRKSVSPSGDHSRTLCSSWLPGLGSNQRLPD